ncbi:hypothetical protein LTR37_013315, partial [Vermiconidia calcicola]
VDVERVRAEVTGYSQPGEDLDWTMVDDISERRRMQSTISRRRCRKGRSSTPMRVQKRPNPRASHIGHSESSRAVQRSRHFDRIAAKLSTCIKNSKRLFRSASVSFQVPWRASSSFQRSRRQRSSSIGDYLVTDTPRLDRRQLKEAARLIALGSNLEAIGQDRAEAQRKESADKELRIEQLEKQVGKLEQDARNTGQACDAGDEDMIQQLDSPSVDVERREAITAGEDSFEKLIRMTGNLELKFEGKMDVDEL